MSVLAGVPQSWLLFHLGSPKGMIFNKFLVNLSISLNLLYSTHSGVVLVVRTDVQAVRVLLKVMGSIHHRISTLQ